MTELVATGFVASSFAALFGALALGLSRCLLHGRQRLSAAAWHHALVLVFAALVVLPWAVPESWLGWGKGEAARYVVAPADPAGKFPEHVALLAAPSVGAGTVLLGFLGWIWFLGMAVCLLRLARRLRGVRRLLRTARPVADAGWNASLREACERLGVRRRPALLSHPEASSPMAWGPRGLRSACIVLPADHVHDLQGDDGVRVALLHELAHLLRRDGLWSLLAELVCALHWYAPSTWRLRRELELAQEMAADSRVVTAGVLPSTYARVLLDGMGD